MKLHRTPTIRDWPYWVKIDRSKPRQNNIMLNIITGWFFTFAALIAAIILFAMLRIWTVKTLFDLQ